MATPEHADAWSEVQLVGDLDEFLTTLREEHRPHLPGQRGARRDLRHRSRRATLPRRSVRAGLHRGQRAAAERRAHPGPSAPVHPRCCNTSRSVCPRTPRRRRKDPAQRPFQCLGSWTAPLSPDARARTGDPFVTSDGSVVLIRPESVSRASGLEGRLRPLTFPAALPSLDQLHGSTP
jgi:hypothetical protein